jgi:hypothetical protein
VAQLDGELSSLSGLHRRAAGRLHVAAAAAKRHRAEADSARGAARSMATRAVALEETGAHQQARCSHHALVRLIFLQPGTPRPMA